MPEQQFSPVRNPLIVAAALDALSEMQTWRDALDSDDQSLEQQLHDILAAGTTYYATAAPIGALLLTDHALGDQFKRVAKHSGLGPHVAVQEVLGWVRRGQAAGRIHPDHDPRGLAIMVCSCCQYMGTLGNVLPDDLYDEVIGPVDAMIPPLLTLLTRPPKEVD